MSTSKKVAQSPCQCDITSRGDDFQNGEQSVHRRVMVCLCFFSGRKLGRYADQELLKSIFQNKTPDLHILIQVHDQQGQQCQ